MKAMCLLWSSFPMLATADIAVFFVGSVLAKMIFYIGHLCRMSWWNLEFLRKEITEWIFSFVAIRSITKLWRITISTVTTSVTSATVNACLLTVCLYYLAPRLKGRPRKRTMKQSKSRFTRASSPESSSEESTKPRRSRRAATSSLVPYVNYSETRVSPRRNRSKRNLKSRHITSGNSVLGIDSASQSNKAKLEGNSASDHDTDSSSSSSVDANNNNSINNVSLHICMANSNAGSSELKRKVQNESTFLQELTSFMKERKTPIQRVPNLGFKKSTLPYTLIVYLLTILIFSWSSRFLYPRPKARWIRRTDQRTTVEKTLWSDGRGQKEY